MNTPDYPEIAEAWEKISEEFDADATDGDIYKIVSVLADPEYYSGRFNETDSVDQYLNAEIFARIAGKIYQETRDNELHFSKYEMVSTVKETLELDEKYEWDDDSVLKHAISERETNFITLQNGLYVATCEISWMDQHDSMILDTLFEVKPELINDQTFFINFLDGIQAGGIVDDVENIEPFIPIEIKSDISFIKELSHTSFYAASKYMSDLCGGVISFDTEKDLGDFIDKYD
ncbi:MAG TPA: hypothetical protein VM577_12970, partial [Anaerovoracaceae bacterium]|nr:hypothetical protein [Anaerovoracaceae bacterium]